MGDSPDKTANDLSSDLQHVKEDLEDALKRRDARAIEALRVRYDALQARWRTHAQAQIEQVKNAAVTPAPPATLNAQIYPIPPVRRLLLWANCGDCAL